MCIGLGLDLDYAGENEEIWLSFLTDAVLRSGRSIRNPFQFKTVLANCIIVGNLYSKSFLLSVFIYSSLCFTEYFL